MGNDSIHGSFTMNNERLWKDNIYVDVLGGLDFEVRDDYLLVRFDGIEKITFWVVNRSDVPVHIRYGRKGWGRKGLKKWVDTELPPNERQKICLEVDSDMVRFVTIGGRQLAIGAC